jgi:hypothetical protein
MLKAVCLIPRKIPISTTELCMEHNFLTMFIYIRKPDITLKIYEMHHPIPGIIFSSNTISKFNSIF